MQKSVADADPIPQSKRTAKSTIILRVRDSIFIVFRGPVLGLAYRFLPFAARSFPAAPTARERLAMTEWDCRKALPQGDRAANHFHFKKPPSWRIKQCYILNAAENRVATTGETISRLLMWRLMSVSST
jgi:hypothetical protein